MDHMKKCPKIPLQCPDCKGKKFTSVESLQHHLRHDCPNVEITCNMCDKDFFRYNLKNNFESVKHKCVSDKQTKELRQMIKG